MTGLSRPDGVVDGFRELLVAEYTHVGESLLHNEADGERRAAFLLTLVGAAGTVLAFLLGQGANLGPATVEPVIVVTLTVVAAFGYFTFVRVVTRNMASDRYKAALNRIRQAFLSGADDPRRKHLAFDPFVSQPRQRPTWTSIGRGGWLETVAFVESVVVGALAAMTLRTEAWWQDGLAALIAAGVSWCLLIADARRRYAGSR